MKNDTGYKPFGPWLLTEFKVPTEIHGIAVAEEYAEAQHQHVRVFVLELGDEVGLDIQPGDMIHIRPDARMVEVKFPNKRDIRYIHRASIMGKVADPEPSTESGILVAPPGARLPNA